MGFDTEDNNRGYKMFDEEYLEWDNATQKCQALGARLPVLSDAATIKIVKKYLDTADFDVFEVKSWKNQFLVWLIILCSNGTDPAGESGLASSIALALASPGLMDKELWLIQHPADFLSGRAGGCCHKRYGDSLQIFQHSSKPFSLGQLC